MYERMHVLYTVPPPNPHDLLHLYKHVTGILKHKHDGLIVSYIDRFTCYSASCALLMALHLQLPLYIFGSSKAHS